MADRNVLLRRAAVGLGVLIVAFILYSRQSAVAGATRAADSMPVAFLQGEQLAVVTRPGSSPTDAVRALLAGPTVAERRRGFRTYLAAGTKLHRIGVSGSLATVDLNRAFAAGSAERRAARLAQLLKTLTGVDGITRVQVLVDGSPPIGLVADVSLAKPITLRLLETPNVAVPIPPQPRLPAPDAPTKSLQEQLINLGYLLPGDDDGRFGPATSDALLTFQKWEHLNRTGMLDATTKAQLVTATRPVPASTAGRGKRAEILLDRQVALLIKDNTVVRAISVSTGKASTPTPPGDYHVYAKIPRWWSTPFREWLPWAVPFVGGIAFHQYEVVPTYPASHGCVRQHPNVAQWTYNFAYVGMSVKVIARS